MLGGALPSEAGSLSDWRTTIPRFSPTPLQKRNPDVPPRLAEVVMQAMANDPAERPTARELEPMLRRAVAGGA